MYMINFAEAFYRSKSGCMREGQQEFKVISKIQEYVEEIKV